MGAVYRATDTKLNREVAIKVLPEAFAADPDRMARFTREAQVLASLNHPNIAAIYGIEQGAIVMELVEGSDLKGPVSLDTALDYAHQIAAGLEAAHEKGIVHRDLKPANIKVTPEGAVKLLDFGLAKAGETSAPAASSAGPTQSPTLSLAMTQAGMILGTAAYMSPEQARGKPVDKRADIWAFGVVLFEMLTGTVLFAQGETVTDIIAAVVTREPDWSALPKDTPPHVLRLLRRCLQKDPKLRLRDIGEARILLDSPPEPESPRAAPPQPRTPRLPWMLAAAMTLAALVAAGIAWKATRPADRPLSRFLIDLGPDAVRGGQLTAIPSPDGRRLVFLVRGADGLPQLATRLLNESAATLLPGTNNAEQPFFSPDGQWIGFFSGQTLKKISVQGGAAVTLWESVAPPRGAAWMPDGTIVANLDNVHLFRLPDTGGKPVPLGEPSKYTERNWRWPQALGDGQVLFAAGAGGLGTGYEESNLRVISLGTGQTKVVMHGGYFPRYLPSGHLVYLHQGTLFAVRFDARRLEMRGSPIPILDDVAGVPTQGAGQFGFSQTGVLVYLNGKSSDTSWNLSWVDPAGKLEPVWNSRSAILSPKISPNGQFVAGSTSEDTFYVYDSKRGAATALTLAGRGRSDVWAPDGKHLLYSGGSGEKTGQLALWWIRADGSAAPTRLYLAPPSYAGVRVTSITADGRHAAFWQSGASSQPSVWILPLDLKDPEHPRAGTPELFIDHASDAAFSPDGRWIAYTSAPVLGVGQIFVRPFPQGEGQWQVSTAGGSFPVWSPKGGELFYRSSPGQIQSVAYQAHGSVFEAARPVQWSPTPAANLASFSPYDVAPDGKRFLIYPTAAPGFTNDAGNVRVTVLLNFFDELQRRLP